MQDDAELNPAKVPHEESHKSSRRYFERCRLTFSIFRSNAEYRVSQRL